MAESYEHMQGVEQDVSNHQSYELGVAKLKRMQGVPELQNQYDMDKAVEVSDAVPRNRK